MKRLAIYYTPRPRTSLAQAAEGWLGRSILSSRFRTQPGVAPISPARLAELTATPFHYGFHATLKPPFHLAEGSDTVNVIEALDDFCVRRKPVNICTLQIAAMDGFLCLRPSGTIEPLNALAAEVVRHFDHLSRPPAPEESARRRKAGLSARQENLLLKWGYPYVMEEFRFHLTLTARLDDPHERIALAAFLADHFSQPLSVSHTIDGLSLFEEVDGAPFIEIHFSPFSGSWAPPGVNPGAAA